ncbi:hypothetical protein ACRB68_17200 [Actinomadura sp. RB68]|uniref:Uncharacterized protein n=1 Tax=Actinomadura macrotermitis TaxID=2585200 RepID=A0A7K0BR54_9ACTN|nr:hypothetical protein [Actinomadura macrotermitis]
MLIRLSSRREHWTASLNSDKAPDPAAPHGRSSVVLVVVRAVPEATSWSRPPEPPRHTADLSGRAMLILLCPAYSVVYTLRFSSRRGCRPASPNSDKAPDPAASHGRSLLLCALLRLSSRRGRRSASPNSDRAPDPPRPTAGLQLSYCCCSCCRARRTRSRFSVEAPGAAVPHGRSLQLSSRRRRRTASLNSDKAPDPPHHTAGHRSSFRRARRATGHFSVEAPATPRHTAGVQLSSHRARRAACPHSDGAPARARRTVNAG